MAENIEITFLGTGSAVPTARRNHTGTLLKYKEQNILFDCGEGIQRQFRIAKINPCKLTKIFISHWHGDHILGLVGLFQTLAMNGYNGKLQIYGPRGTERAIDSILESYMGRYLQDSKSEGYNFKIVASDVDEGVLDETEEYIIEARRTEHGIASLAYSFVVKEKNRIDKEKLKKLNIKNSPLIAELIKGKNVMINKKKVNWKEIVYKEKQRKVSIILDTRMNSDLIKLSKNSNVLISESTYSSEEQIKANERGHLTPHDAANIAKESDSKLLILTHLSQRYSNIPHVLEHEAQTIFKNSKVVEDFDQIIL